MKKEKFPENDPSWLPPVDVGDRVIVDPEFLKLFSDGGGDCLGVYEVKEFKPNYLATLVGEGESPITIPADQLKIVEKFLTPQAS